ncbi:MAG: ASPIC/UnbV domain-containing protein, partial [Planctomycetes bacterium]|nr:ASPIC/UnbV domain-containing protein [Planctomycetota bacterium]
NRSAVGARIEVTTDLMTVVKEVSGGAGRGSFNDLPVEFGLGNATTIEQVAIRWPSGIVMTLDDVVMDQVRTVVERAPIIPAASLWGLVALALAVLASSTVILRRQRRVLP